MRKIATGLFCLLVTSSVFAQLDRKQLADEVKTEFLHAWNGYKKYAWGNDDLKPLSKSFHNWYAEPLLMTPVDALDTMYIMGFKKEADETRKYITENLSFDKDIYVQNFEITIRLLGGLLSNYQITGDKKLLAMAEDLGTRLLPVFESPTGLPYRYVNLQNGKDAWRNFESCRNRNADHRVWDAQQTDRKADLLRQGETCACRNVQASIADRSRRYEH